MRLARKKTIDRGIHALLMASAGLTILTTLSVIFILGKESFSFFSQVPVFDFLFGTRWEPLLEPKSFGVLPLLSGTAMIVVGAMVVALPIGLLISIYLSEYASGKFRAIVKPTLEVLAGIPTVVYGYFALTFITPIIRYFYPDTGIFNAASGAIVVGIMILPMISSLCDDALQSIPRSMKEAGVAMGATSFEVITQILLPASASRMGAAVILAISRAIGETMAVTLAAGATPKLGVNPFESIQTITAYIVQVSMGDTPAGGIEYLTCFAVAGLLFVLTFAMNLIGSWIILKGRVKGV